MKKKGVVFLIVAAVFFLSGCKASAPKQARPEYKEAFQEMCDALDGRYGTEIEVVKLAMTEEEYGAKKAEIEKRLPDVSGEGELYCLLQELAAGFQDLHTSVWVDYQKAPEEFYFLPCSFVTFNGEFYLNQCLSSEQDYLGWKLCGINGHSIKSIREKMSKFVSMENEYSLNLNMETALSSADVLKHLNIMKDEKGEVELMLQNPETKEKEKVLCKSMTYRQKSETEYQTLSREQDIRTAPEATYRSFLLEDSVYFIQINQHVEEEGVSVNQWNDQILEDLKNNQPEKIIIDLRYNTGGYSGLFRNLMTKLKQWQDQTGMKVYTLISNRTASAALMTAVETRDELGSILIGEPTCQRPNFNGHMAGCKLGSTPLELQYSTLYIRTLEDGDELTALEPDILVPQTLDDWMDGEDAAVDMVLAQR